MGTIVWLLIVMLLILGPGRITARVTWEPCTECGNATQDRICDDCRQAKGRSAQSKRHHPTTVDGLSLVGLSRNQQAAQRAPERQYEPRPAR